MNCAIQKLHLPPNTHTLRRLFSLPQASHVGSPTESITFLSTLINGGMLNDFQTLNQGGFFWTTLRRLSEVLFDTLPVRYRTSGGLFRLTLEGHFHTMELRVNKWRMSSWSCPSHLPSSCCSVTILWCGVRQCVSWSKRSGPRVPQPELSLHTGPARHRFPRQSFRASGSGEVWEGSKSRWGNSQQSALKSEREELDTWAG